MIVDVIKRLKASKEQLRDGDYDEEQRLNQIFFF